MTSERGTRSGVMLNRWYAMAVSASKTKPATRQPLLLESSELVGTASGEATGADALPPAFSDPPPVMGASGALAREPRREVGAVSQRNQLSISLVKRSYSSGDR